MACAHAGLIREPLMLPGGEARGRCDACDLTVVLRRDGTVVSAAQWEREQFAATHGGALCEALMGPTMLDLSGPSRSTTAAIGN